MEWRIKILVQTRIAANRLEKIGATIQTITMVCCWVEGLALITMACKAILNGEEVLREHCLSHIDL